jgi:hypothetical protein
VIPEGPAGRPTLRPHPRFKSICLRRRPSRCCGQPTPVGEERPGPSAVALNVGPPSPKSATIGVNSMPAVIPAPSMIDIGVFFSTGHGLFASVFRRHGRTSIAS